MLSVPSSPFPFECLVCLSWSTLPDLGDEIAAEIGHVCLIILCCNINSNIRSIILKYMIKFSNSCLHPWLITNREIILSYYGYLLNSLLHYQDWYLFEASHDPLIHPDKSYEHTKLKGKFEKQSTNREAGHRHYHFDYVNQTTTRCFTKYSKYNNNQA